MSLPVRQLPHILAADVAGYSRLTGADQEGALERLKASRFDHVRDPLPFVFEDLGEQAGRGPVWNPRDRV
jgi:hypothetical protein